MISRSTFAGQGHYGGHWSGDNFARYEDMYLSIPGHFVILACLFNVNFRSSTSTKTLILLKYSNTNILIFCCFLIFLHGRNMNSLFVDDFRNVEHEHVWNLHDWC